MTAVLTADVRYVKELYPRLKPSDEVIERYMDALDLLPPIVIARDGIIVDGFHRWQAHVRAGVEKIEAEHLGDLSDAEILRESYRRNSTHGHQLSKQDKKRAADHLYRTFPGSDDERYSDIAGLLGITDRTARDYCSDARRDEQKSKRENVVLDWLDNPQDSNVTIAKRHDVAESSLRNWISQFSEGSEICEPPASRQHFDVWSFGSDKDSDTTYFGKMPEQIVENLLWLYTDPGDVVVDLFAGSGTTIEVARRMGRRVWASDRASAGKYPHLPIRTHDATSGWPADAPSKANLVILDPPYWIQAKGRYSEDPEDLANKSLADWDSAWADVAKTVTGHTERVAFIVSPAIVDGLANGHVVDLAYDMYGALVLQGFQIERRIIVTYNTQQSNGAQVEAAREHRKLLHLYRDLVVMSR